MGHRSIIVLSLFTLTVNISCQYYDPFSGLQQYFQNLQSQSYNTPKVEHTKKVTNTEQDDRKPYKQNRPVSSEDRSKAKQKPTRVTPVEIFNLGYITTPKPSRKTTKTSSHKTYNSNFEYDDNSNKIVSYERPNYTTQKTHLMNRPYTQDARPNVTPNPFAVTRPNSRPNNVPSRPEFNTDVRPSNKFTTHNPLLNRPGVKPALVDSNRPPITNRPPNRPTSRPFATYPKPTDSSAIRYPEDPDTSPEVMVGLDEDQMSSADKRSYIDVAEKMCDQYKALNVKKVEAIPLLPSPDPVQVNVSVCPPTTIPLVVGGKVVTIEEFPHMALLGWTRLQGGGYSWKCGGTLISDQYVLTAGHCAYQEKDDSVVPGAPRVVQLGSSLLDDTGALVMKVLYVVRHPKYTQTRSYYDIALVKLVKPLTFSEVIKPACLGVPPGVGEPVIATGWGRTEFGGTQSSELRSVSVPIWDMEECRKVLGTSRKLPNGPSRDNQICAGEKNGGKDTCQGDSGGPAQIQDGCVWRVVAVTSVGRSCGAPNTPALYATLHRAFISAEVFGKSTNSQGSQNGNSNNKPVLNHGNSNSRPINNSNRPNNQNNNDNKDRYDHQNAYQNSRPNSNSNSQTDSNQDEQTSNFNNNRNPGASNVNENVNRRTTKSPQNEGSHNWNENVNNKRITNSQSGSHYSSENVGNKRTTSPQSGESQNWNDNSAYKRTTKSPQNVENQNWNYNNNNGYNNDGNYNTNGNYHNGHYNNDGSYNNDRNFNNDGNYNTDGNYNNNGNYNSRGQVPSYDNRPQYEDNRGNGNNEGRGQRNNFAHRHGIHRNTGYSNINSRPGNSGWWPSFGF